MKTFYTHFFHSSPIIFGIHEIKRSKDNQIESFTIYDVNLAFEAFFQVEKEKIQGLSSCGFFQFEEGEQKQLFHQIEQVVEGKSQGKMRLKKPIHHHYIELDFFFIDESYIGCIIQDTTKEELISQELETFLSINLDMLCVLDQKGKIIKTNLRFQEATGYQSSDLVGKNINHFFFKKDVFSNHITNIIDEDNQLNQFTEKFKTQTGFVYLEWRCEKVNQYIYCAIRDVTKQTEEQELLIKQAQTDYLTKLYNRHYFYEIVEEEIHLANVSNQSLVLSILDIDHFKLVNDVWGHPVGDRVLETLSEILQTHVDDNTVLCRLGGEEFVILMKNTSLANAREDIEALRRKISDYHFSMVGHVTASFGVSLRMPYETFKSWYKRVDDALYLAKENGRNQVVEASNDISKFSSQYLEWDDSWTSHHPSIDKEHLQMLESGKRMLYLIQQNASTNILEKEINHLIRLVETHFENEEKILLSVQYPHFKNHQMHHQRLLKQTQDLKNQLDEDLLSIEVMYHYLINLFIMDHLIKEDMKYFTYLK